MTQEYIGKTPYAGFGFVVKETATDNDEIISNQTLFGGKIFEVLGHAETIEELKDIWGNAFGDHKISYFKMEELVYRNGTEKTIKYRILEIIEA